MDISGRIGAVMGLDPSVPAVQYEGRWYTWGDIGNVGKALDVHLAELPPEAPVGVLTRNRPSIVAVVMALLARRRAILAVNSLHPDRGITNEVNELRPMLLVGAAEDWSRQALREAVSQTGTHALAVRDDLSGVDVVVARGEAAVAGLRTLGDDAAISLQTSGTTGPPKRVTMTYANLSASVTGVLRHYSGKDGGEIALRPGVVIQMLPLGHTSALLTLVLMAVEGRRMVLLDRFEPTAWAAAVRDHQVAVAGMPPAAIRMVLDAGIPREWLASLKAVRAGTAPLDPDLAAEFQRTYGIPVIQAYGATEFQGVASWSLRDFKKYGAEKSGSVGRAHPGVELRTVDPVTGEVQPKGAVGVLEVRSAQSAGARSDEWVRTSDLARVDEDGFLWILGRTDDVINRGGFKIDAREVADVLREHPSVDDAAVVGAPDRRLGSVPVAAVASDREPAPTEAELREWVRERLEPYKVPVRIAVVAQLPRNATMKVGVREVLDLVGWEDGQGNGA